MLLDRDYECCAETMLIKFGVKALVRAEHRARELLLADSRDGHDIWIRVAATIRKMQAATKAA
ncbi:MAG TPA: hypothetical protein VE914_04520 [Candidatus Angelobacter sp.]|nr:hypothetical protein [Candidatus Angelobacter sp.]